MTLRRCSLMSDLSVKICGVEFGNPLIAASGTFGFGREFAEFYPLSVLGGISCKGITLKPMEGNPPPRIAETEGGILNAVGLQNPGVDHFIEKDLPWLKEQNTRIIANIAGNTQEDYCAMAEKLSDSDVDFVELNISCPNVKSGGVQFCTSCESVGAITDAVKRHCKKPLMVKLSPNVTDIAEIAKSAEYNGADVISMINTLTGMRIDINSKRPIIRNNTGGLSGAAVFPVAVRMIWQVYNAVKIPIVGMGGVSKWQDAVEMLMAGASALQIGTVLFNDPYAPVKINEGISKFMDENGIKNISDITGTVIPW
jgi:dihydroorotate dehydrogenase (NAD+) catalytic subunit